MEIVVAHNNSDFDSLASQFAVTKLFPGTKMAPSNMLSPNIREFLTLYRDSLPIVDLQYVDADKINHVFVVDCQNIERLDEVPRTLISQKRATHTVFDHHELDPHGLSSSARADSRIEAVGSCTAMLTGSLMEKSVQLQPFEATLLLIGIYEDTGCMTYSGTTELDARCVAHLLGQGADLNQVNNFINPKLGEEQTALFQSLIANAETVTISGAKVMISQGRCQRYIEGLSTLTRRLLEVSSADAAVTIVYMRDRTHIVCRSDSPLINLRTVAREFGGDGHPGAASAVTKDNNLEGLRQKVVSLLRRNTSPEITAAQVMSTPVRTLKPEVAMDEAGKIMLRYGQDGLVVMDDSGLTGIVSKRDVDKALHHKLGHAPVKGFMSTPVISVSEKTPISEIQSTMVKKDIGRLPVLNADGDLIGIVTRKDVLATLYGADAAGKRESQISPEQRRIDFRDRVQSLDEPTQWLFSTIGKVAADSGMLAYAVGGCVRDLYMERANFDLDFVIEGSAIDLAQALELAYPGRFELIAKHDRFKTATIIFKADRNREVDLSTARTEFYEFPAALPTVEASRLEHDLFRRDFTINALALGLNDELNGFVIDFFNGVNDIESKLIRVLHPFSFIEDPTRIIRAVRFASRLGFTIEEKTRQQAQRAIAMGVFDSLGGFRLKEELRILFESNKRLSALEILNDLGSGLRYLAPNLAFDDKVRAHIRRAERMLVRIRLDRQWIIYLALLLAPLVEADREVVMDRLVLSNDERNWIREGFQLLRELSVNNCKWLLRSDIFSLLHGRSDQSLSIAACLASPGSPTRRWIKLYLEELKSVRTSVSGNDLISLGFPKGPLIKEALSKVHVARLDGLVKTPAEEFAFLKQHYSQFFAS